MRRKGCNAIVVQKPIKGDRLGMSDGMSDEGDESSLMIVI